MPSRVPTHRPPASAAAGASGQAHYDRHRRDREARRFYQSPAWRSLRLVKLRRDPLCQDCEGHGRLTPATEVHHELERRDRPDLALDLDNLASLCRPCHNRRRKHAEQPGPA
jgi:5-methylcytosine-specific restriction protein A